MKLLIDKQTSIHQNFSMLLLIYILYQNSLLEFSLLLQQLNYMCLQIKFVSSLFTSLIYLLSFYIPLSLYIVSIYSRLIRFNSNFMASDHSLNFDEVVMNKIDKLLVNKI